MSNTNQSIDHKINQSNSNQSVEGQLNEIIQDNFIEDISINNQTINNSRLLQDQQESQSDKNTSSDSELGTTDESNDNIDGDSSTTSIDNQITTTSTTTSTVNTLCLEYLNGNTLICSKCTDGYALLLFNTTSTICAQLLTSSTTKSCIIDTDTYPYEKSIADMLGVVSFKYVEKTSSVQQGYCFDCTVFNYNAMYSTSQSTCSSCDYSTLTSDIIQHSILSASFGCTSCDAADGFRNELVTYRQEADLFTRTCELSSLYSQTPIDSQICQFSEYFDTTTQKCLSCSSIFPNCAACSPTQCTICLDNFYYHQSAYNPVTNSRQAMCLFNTCPVGYCKDTDRKVCVKSTLSNCLKCQQISTQSPVIQKCTLCEKSYLPFTDPTTTQQTCKLLTGSSTWNYFVQSGAPLRQLDYNYDHTLNTGLSPTFAFLQIQEALNAIHKRQQVNYVAEVTAYIYLGKGSHFFMQCDGDESTVTFSVSKIKSNFVDYCTQLKIYKSLVLSDSISIHIRPLQCNSATSLGISSTNSAFTSMCMRLSIDERPTVHVNSATTYFNISGTMTFDNIIFSGINAFARHKTSTVDLSIFPILLCDNIKEIVYGDKAISFEKMNQYDYVVNNLDYFCKDAWYQLSTIPKDFKTNNRCAQNQGKSFYPKKQSTLSCGLDPNDSDFFYIQSGSQVYSKRHQTLFNIYAFPEYLTTYSKPPMLNITNCDFKYFMGNYTSLINIENNNLNRVSVKAPINILDTVQLMDRHFFTYSGAQRGARIFISNSKFSESRFCQGLIVNRKQWYMPFQTSLLNNTQLFLEKSTISDEGSYILIQDSDFKNLNHLTNVTALAIYGGKTPYETSRGLNSLQNMTYQATIHKGIVLNIEDFNGFIEIAGSNFEKNMHFIPEIMITPFRTEAVRNLDHFKDQFGTQEFKIVTCNKNTMVDQFLFQEGFGQSDNMDDYFQKFERLGLIYISRNKQPIIIRQNTFTENIGTFGAAITINSPDWHQGSSPYIVISDNTFKNNFAYFSGNAIYIQDTMSKNEQNNFCGGIMIQNSLFVNNTGMKAHNGGAISTICRVIEEPAFEDYDHTSSFWQDDINSNLVAKVTSVLQKEVQFKLLATQFSIISSNFIENYSGQRGTAVYLYHMNRIRIQNSTFVRNGPVFANIDINVSPYVKYFSLTQSVVFRDITGGCKNELSYVDKCANQDYRIDWSQVRGALYVEHCNEEDCMSFENIQQLSIDSCVFVNNAAGPYLDSNQPYDLAQSLYIQGGFNNSIKNSTFRDHQSFSQLNVSNSSTKLASYFPKTYFTLGQAPVIRIMITPKYLTGEKIFDYSANFKNVSFLRNKHVQILGQNFLKQYYGSLIAYETNYMYGDPFAPQLSLDNCTFRENYFIGNETSLIYLFKGLLKVTNTLAYGNGYLTKTSTVKAKSSSSYYFPFQHYVQNLYQFYGLFYLLGLEEFPNGYYHQFVNNTFRYNFGYEGAGFSLKIDSQYALFQNNSFRYHVVNKQGGAIYARNQDGRSTFKIVDQDVQFMFAKSQGSISMEPHDHDFLSVLIYNSTFRNNRASEGSSIFLDSMAYILIQNCTFANNIWPTNMTAYIEQRFVKQTMALNEFVDYKYLYSIVDQGTPENGAIYNEQNLNTKQVKFLDKIIKNATDPTLTYADIIDCSFHNLTAESGAAVQIGKESYARIFNVNLNQRSLIQNNTVNQYGAIYVFSTHGFYAKNLYLTQNNALSRGSAFGGSNSIMTLENCTFTQNTALDKGTLYFYEDNNFTCNRCTLIGNYAKDSSTFFSLNNINGFFRVFNSRFQLNKAISNTATFILSNATFINTTFLDNVASQVNHGITLISSDFVASNITVNYTNPTFLADYSDDVDAGFFSINYQSSLLIQNYSTFENCRGSQASVIYATGFSSVKLENYITIKNSASFSGSTIVFSLTNKAEVYDTMFWNNTQVDIEANNVNLKIGNSYFTQGSQNFIKASLSNVTIKKTTFINGLNYNLQGKAIFCSCDNLLVDNCLFQNLSSLEGGAIYITSSKRTSNFTIHNSTFYNNSAMHGGSIKVIDAAHLNISRNTFTHNWAYKYELDTSQSIKLVQKGLGGALNLDCFNEQLGLDTNCDFFIGLQNKFTGNIATEDGGAISWYSNRYKDDGSNVFSNNYAPYGPNVSNYGHQLVFQYVSNRDYLNPISNPIPMYNSTQLRFLQESNLTDEELGIFRMPLYNHSSNQRNLLQQNIVLNSVVSGTPLWFIAYILDMDSNLYKTDSQSVASLRSLNKGVILQNFEVNAIQGIYNFTKFTINLEPGQEAQLNFQISSFETYANDISFIKESPLITIQSRKCAQGEQYTPDKRCIRCNEGEYLYYAPSNTTSCIPCQNEALCYGLFSVSPRPGYWRSSNTSTLFIQCPNQQACLGGNISQPLGQCALGYTGVVCGNCIAGFKKSNNFVCTKCPNQGLNSVQFLGLIIVSAIICVILVKSNISSVDKEKPLYTVYMKVMTNHFQIISAITAIDYNWPYTIQTLQEGQLQLSSFTDDIFSFDCFLQSSGFVDESDRIYLQKVIFYALLPLILTAVSVIIWYIIGFLKKDYRFKDKLIGTIVVLLFLIHPSIAKALFSAFNCIEIEGVSRLKDNVGMECYQGKHLVYVLVIIIPSLIIWIFGIPFVALIMMFKNKTTIIHMSKSNELSKYDKVKIKVIRTRIGFLLNGFQRNNFFWEILILYRKILIVMVTVLLNSVSAESQVLVVLMILVLSVLLHLNYNPYYTFVLNKMELYSLQVACITMYGGMFYVTGSHYTYMNNIALGYIFLLMIVVPNALFFLYWIGHMRIEVMKMLYVSHPRAFKWFTCGYYKDSDAFERKYMTQETTNTVENPYEVGKLGESPYKTSPGYSNSKNYGNQEDGGVDDFSNVIMRRFNDNDKIGHDKSDNPRNSISDSDDYNLSRKFEKKEFNIGSSDYDDDTGDSKNKTVSSKDIRLQFPANMMSRIVQPDDQEDRQNQRERSPQAKGIYNRLTDASPMTTNRYDINMTTNQALQSSRAPMSSRKIFPESLANQLTSRQQQSSRKFNNNVLFGNNHPVNNQSIDSTSQQDITLRSDMGITDRATNRELLQDRMRSRKDKKLNIKKQQLPESKAQNKKYYETQKQIPNDVRNNRRSDQKAQKRVQDYQIDDELDLDQISMRMSDREIQNNYDGLISNAKQQQPNNAKQHRDLSQDFDQMGRNQGFEVTMNKLSLRDKSQDEKQNRKSSRSQQRKKSRYNNSQSDKSD